RAIGARTYVVERDPVRALEAHIDGHSVGDPEAVLPAATMVVTATGGVRAVGADELALVADDAVLANAGHHDLEIDVDALAGMASRSYASADGVQTFVVGEREVHVLVSGSLVNIAGGSGHP